MKQPAIILTIIVVIALVGAVIAMTLTKQPYDSQPVSQPPTQLITPRMPGLDADGCNPACVVSEATRAAEVNWRCTGLVVPPINNGESNEDGGTDSSGSSGTMTRCEPSQRNAEICIQLYAPVCATVNVQCITTPCNPVQQTFGNSCEACANPLVEGYVQGECS
ncbi:MAG: hypothetical protein UY09_C0007G0014 [Parcubacteria group bacterium GW2011_GWA2_47_8]|nr:MAG: hypothetical protein UY09_C0007G0014 [Parcubacteria group bacterium GW2011_GWA2_47_8]